MFRETIIALAAIITIFFGVKLYSEYKLNNLLRRKHKAMRVENAYPVKKSSWVKALVPAATMAIAIALNPAVDFQPTLNNVEIAEINSDADIKQLLEDFNQNQSPMFRNFGAVEEVAVLEMAPESAEFATDDASAKAESHTETNVQVQGVDEIDNVKTDGEFIYSINYGYRTGNNSVVITRAWPVSEFSVHKTLDFTNNECEDYCANEWVNGVYVDDDYLLVVTNRYTYQHYVYTEEKTGDEEATEELKLIEPFFGTNETVVYVYSKADDFELQDTYRFEGNMSGTRKIDNNLFIITNHWLNVEDDTLLPEFAVNEDVKGSTYEDVTYIKDTNPHTFTSIYGIDLDSKEVDVENILGSNSYTLYVSNNNIYTIDYKYYIMPFLARVGIDEDFERPEETVAISKFSLEGNDITLAAVGEVKGNPLNQFSMDEHNGYFRITTTSGWGEDINNRLYILDEGLTIVSEIEKLGKPGERLQSTRFMGDVAYLVTFQQTDPFYVIDVADPEAPVVLGELEITGFSTYLHPIDKDHILGIGFEADEEGRRIGLKLSIYDVTDQTNPVETYKHVILYEEHGWNWSSVTYNHKDLLFDSAKGIIGFPFSSDVYEDNQFRFQTGYLLFNFDVNDGLEELGYLTHGNTDEYYDYIQKGLFLEDYLYTVANSKIGVSHIDNIEELIELIKIEVE